MKNKPREPSATEQCTYLFNASFSADDATYNPDITPKAIIAFKKRFDGFLWLVNQDGVIIGHKMEKSRRINFRIDFSAGRTAEYFNLLPTIFANKATRMITAAFSLAVVYYDDEVSNETTEHKDVIMLSDGYFYLKDFRRVWEWKMKWAEILRMDAAELMDNL